VLWQASAKSDSFQKAVDSLEHRPSFQPDLNGEQRLGASCRTQKWKIKLLAAVGSDLSCIAAVCGDIPAEAQRPLLSHCCIVALPTGLQQHTFPARTDEAQHNPKTDGLKEGRHPQSASREIQGANADPDIHNTASRKRATTSRCGAGFAPKSELS
jgi:hypothetical protein